MVESNTKFADGEPSKKKKKKKTLLKILIKKNWYKTKINFNINSWYVHPVGPWGPRTLFKFVLKPN